jgi:uracil-DNA glycosylase
MPHHDPAAVAPGLPDIPAVSAAVSDCFACPRLVAWREHVALERRAAYADEEYWGRPVPGFGDTTARIVVVGLAPAAHGANRTGRMFTGDRSGDWLFRAMYRAGLANQPTSVVKGDGLELRDAWVTAPVRCAPPANKPTPDERLRCQPWLLRELELLPDLRVAVVLGSIGYQALWGSLRDLGLELPTPRPRFGHGVEIPLPGGLTVICSYHPSQQNTFTGKLTEPMLDGVFLRAMQIAAADG